MHASLAVSFLFDIDKKNEGIHVFVNKCDVIDSRNNYIRQPGDEQFDQKIITQYDLPSP